MVKVTGPMMSLGASGTLADAITFSTWKGHPYVRERVIPANPKSGDQVGRRAMLSFLTKAWSALSAANKATWKDLAEQLVASNFNACLSEGMKGWHNFLAPSEATPATRTGTPSDNQMTAAVWENNRIKLTVSGTTLNNAWGIIIFGTPDTSITPAVGNAIIVKADTTFAQHFIYWTPPKVILYTFKSITFSTDGKKDWSSPPQTATPP